MTTTRTISRQEIESLTREADDAFWAVIVRHFPEAKNGDLSPERTIALTQAAEEAVEEWIGNNVPSCQLA